MPNFTRRITGNEAVRLVMISMGLTAPDNIPESQDPTAVLLWSLATRAGQRLITAFDWQFLEREQTIVTVAGTTTYDLPDDFDHFIEDSEWNRTTRLPMVGSLRTDEWAMLKARNYAGTTFTMMYRISDDQVEFYAVEDAQQLVLPYTGRGWVKQADTTLADNLINVDDVVKYDSQLFQAAVRLEWDIEKRFDTASSVQAYNQMLTAAMGKDAPARTISLAQGRGYPFLSSLNIPDSGYGL